MAKIIDIPVSERPIERLINSGVKSLSNVELLAIIIKSGSREFSAKDLANKIISDMGDISNLGNVEVSNLIKLNGIGPKKAASIVAALELGFRANKKVDNLSNIKITTSSIIYDYYYDILKDKKQEYFYCIYLDNNKCVIKDKLLYIGTLNFSVVHPREIFKEAYILSAASIVCVHNHPSGNVIPSNQDITLTKKIKEISLLLGINLVDHIIVSRDKYYSFFDNGDL